MRRLAPLILVLLPLPLIGCGSSTPADNEATLRKQLDGPPAIQPGKHKPGPANKAKAAAAGETATTGGTATTGTAPAAPGTGG